MSLIDRLSFQLYSARALPIEAQFAMLAGIGYRNVEPFGGQLGDTDLLKRLIDQYGMKAPSIHVGLDRLRADAKATVGLCRGLGVELLLVPAPPPGERDKDADGWRALGRELNDIGAIVRGEGLRFGWHNHHWEYKRTPAGDLPLDLMFAEAPGIEWEADLAWVVRGDADPIAELARHAGQVTAVHLKDLAPAGECLDEDGWADVGHGVMDWSKIMPAVHAAGVDLFVVEHDKPSDAERFARRAFATVTAW